MHFRRKQRSNSWLKGPKAFVSILAVMSTAGLLLNQLASGVLLAFTQSSWVGFRSLAAATFPIAVAIYLGFIAFAKIPVNESRAPVINNFVIFLFWTLMVLWIDGNVNFVRFPLEELLYSATIAFMIWRYKRQSAVIDLLACCYGVLCGALAGLIFFGWNPFVT